MGISQHSRLLVVGGGTAGMSVAARLRDCAGAPQKIAYLLPP